MPDIEYRNVSTHAQPLASGRVLAPGDSAVASGDPHDLALVESGALVPVETATNYDALHVEQLEGLAVELDVKGTGKDGSVTKVDLVKALTANDKKESR